MTSSPLPPNPLPHQSQGASRGQSHWVCGIGVMGATSLGQAIGRGQGIPRDTLLGQFHKTWPHFHIFQLYVDLWGYSGGWRSYQEVGESGWPWLPSAASRPPVKSLGFEVTTVPSSDVPGCPRPPNSSSLKFTALVATGFTALSSPKLLPSS